MNRLCVYLLLLSLNFFLSPLSFAQPIELEFNQILAIGEQETDSTEYLFSAIRSITVDQNRNIFVADASDNAIRIYNKNGNFLKKIGRRGRGPGEFLQVTFLQSMEDGQLSVLDRFQNRISFFKPSGDFSHSVSLSSESIGATHLFYNTTKEHFYLLNREHTSEAQQAFLLHQYDKSLENKEKEYIDTFKYFFDHSNPLHANISKIPVYKATKFEDEIAITPGVYTGQISIFDMQSNSETVLGKRINDIVTRYDWNSREKYRQSNEVGFASSSGPEGQFFFKRKGASFGLIGNSRFLLYFYGTFYEDRIIPHVDIYKSDGELLAKISLEDHPISFIGNDNTFSFTPHFLDEENNLYASDYYYKDSYPAVRVFKTNLNQLID